MLSVREWPDSRFEARARLVLDEDRGIDLIVWSSKRSEAALTVRPSSFSRAVRRPSSSSRRLGVLGMAALQFQVWTLLDSLSAKSAAPKSTLADGRLDIRELRRRVDARELVDCAWSAIPRPTPPIISMLSRLVEILLFRACLLSRRDWRAVEAGVGTGAVEDDVAADAVLGEEKKSKGIGCTGTMFSLSLT